jgi:flagellar motor switch protein FliG
MADHSHNLRKAAVLIRSLDAETAAILLAQLPPADAAAIRAAVERLGAIDSDEQADVAAELRRAAPLAGAAAKDGVELAISTTNQVDDAPKSAESRPSNSRFEFLEQAPIANLVPYMAREHAQTIALVLSYLSPPRAAAVLAALPPRQQADTLERVAMLGETDPESVKVVEQELAAWMSAQSSLRRGARAGGAVRAILAAADAATRNEIVTNLKTHKQHLAAQFGAPVAPRNLATLGETVAERFRTQPKTQADALRQTLATANEPRQLQAPRQRSQVPRPAAPNVRFDFEDLIRLEPPALAAVMRDVDAKVLVLALAGSSDELVERVSREMPKRTAKAFRRQLRRLGPTRLSDVEAAQQTVARAAARRFGRVAAQAA